MAHQTSAAQANGPISEQDTEFWKSRFNEVLAAPSEHINSRSPEGALSWTNRFFSCITPPSLCLVTCCLPCVTFGKVHHRLHKDVNLQGYEPVNTSCLLFCVANLIPAWAIPIAMQRADVRAKYNLEGSCVMDLLAGCCCGCCTLMQEEKEIVDREASKSQVNNDGYAQQSEMAFPGKPSA